MDLIKTFTINEDNDDIDCLDIIIIKNFEDKRFIYFDNILKKISDEEKSNNEFKSLFDMYFKMYVNENMEEFVQYLLKNYENNLWNYYINIESDFVNILEILPKYKTKHNFITKLLKNIDNEINLCNNMNEWITQSLLFLRGIDYQDKSFMSLFDIINIHDEKELNKMIKLFNKIYTSPKIYKLNIIKLIYQILDSNINYTHINLNIPNHCSTMNFLVLIMYICLNVLYNEINFDNLNNMNKERTTFQIYNDDTFDTQIYFVVNYCIYICYNALLNFKQYYQSRLQQQNTLFIFFDNINTKKLENEINKINNILTDFKINNIIIDYYEKIYDMIETNKIIITENMLNMVINYIDNMLYDFNMHDYNDTIYYLFENIINGKYTNNPHIRYNCANLLFNINRTINNISENTIENYIKYFIDVDYKTWTTSEQEIKHTTLLITSLVEILNINKYYFSSQNENIRTFIYKICSNSINSCSIIENILIEINKSYIINNYSFNNYYKNILDIATKTLYPYIMKINMIAGLINIINNNIDKIPTELINEIILMITSILKCSSNIHFQKINEMLIDNKKPTIISITFYKNILTLFIKKYKNNINCVEYLNQLYDSTYPDDFNLKEVLENISEIKQIIIEYKESLTEENKIDYPEEFLDPILCIKINEPIMIPEIKLIFDKTSIITHLYTSKTNPFTRSPLTEEEVIKYNETAEVIKEIENFKIKLDEFEKNHK